MISINFTLIVELLLLLAFAWMLHRHIWRPLLRLVQTRQDKIAGDRTEADLNLAAAQRLKDAYELQLRERNQRAVKEISDTTYKAHRERRALVAELKIQADMELLIHRNFIQKQVVEQRRRFPSLLPGLIEEMDHQLKKGGGLL